MNQITVSFAECEPTPTNGYNVLWRELNTFGPYNDAGNFTSAPAIFTDDTLPDGTEYEGVIRSDCSESGSSGSDFGESVAWSTGSIPCKQYTMSKTVGSPSAHYVDCDGVSRDTIILTSTTICTNGHGFTISGGSITIDSESDGPCSFEEPVICHEYRVNSFGSARHITWNDCSTGEAMSTDIVNDDPFNICAVQGSVTTSSGEIIDLGACL